jgi:transcriptional regulator with XRE-family HTH domain
LTKAVTPIDALVGVRLRARRQELQISQQELGRRLGITFQQVQKYETGSNRMSAGRLNDISAALDVPISYFFGGNEEEAGGSLTGLRAQGTSVLMKEPGAVRLLAAYSRVPSPSLRRSIVEIVEGLAGNPGDQSFTSSRARRNVATGKTRS